MKRSETLNQLKCYFFKIYPAAVVYVLVIVLNVITNVAVLVVELPVGTAPAALNEYCLYIVPPLSDKIEINNE